LAVWNVEGTNVDAFVTTGDGDVLSTADMRLELDWFVAAELPGFGIDPSVTAQQQLAY